MAYTQTEPVSSSYSYKYIRRKSSTRREEDSAVSKLQYHERRIQRAIIFTTEYPWLSRAKWIRNADNFRVPYNDSRANKFHRIG